MYNMQSPCVLNIIRFFIFIRVFRPKNEHILQNTSCLFVGFLDSMKILIGRCNIRVSKSLLNRLDICATV